MMKLTEDGDFFDFIPVTNPPDSYLDCQLCIDSLDEPSTKGDASAVLTHPQSEQEIIGRGLRYVTAIARQNRGLTGG